MVRLAHLLAVAVTYTLITNASPIRVETTLDDSTHIRPHTNDEQVFVTTHETHEHARPHFIAGGYSAPRRASSCTKRTPEEQAAHIEETKDYIRSLLRHSAEFDRHQSSQREREREDEESVTQIQTHEGAIFSEKRHHTFGVSDQTSLFTFTTRSNGARSTLYTGPKGYASDGTSKYTDYPDDFDFTYEIQTSDGTYRPPMYLSFYYGSTESCCDYLYIAEMREPNTQYDIEALSGDFSGYTFYIPSGRALLYFSTDGSVTYNGWMVGWVEEGGELPPEPTPFGATDGDADQCEGAYFMRSTEGVVTDGVGNYEDNQDCTWFLEPPTPSIGVYIAFFDFATESGFDTVQLYDISYTVQYADLSGEYTDTTVQELRYESDDGMAIEFSTDGSNVDRGFFALWTQLDRSCSGPLLVIDDYFVASATVTPSTMSSPCSWTIRPYRSISIVVQFDEVTLGPSDVVLFFENGDITDESSAEGRRVTQPRSFTISSSSVRIEFHALSTNATTLPKLKFTARAVGNSKRLLTITLVVVCFFIALMLAIVYAVKGPKPSEIM